MAPVSDEDDSPSSDSRVSNSRASSVCSKGSEEEKEHDGYESADSGDSECSVTSCRKVSAVYREELIESFLDPQATDAIISDAADSAHTSWTDEKHSSYLNSIEATFVQKMYDKEYCSFDVCGRSCHSSVTFEQDCVESHPFCFNKTQRAGGFKYEGSCRPCFIAPSVLASPWIQHFKSKQAAPVGKEKNKVKDLRAPGAASSWNCCVSVQRRFDIHKNTPNAGPVPDFLLAMKKRGVSFNLPDCRQSVTQFRGYGTSAQDVLAGRLTKFKKIKCQQMLSQMDMEMEEQFISQWRENNCADADSANEGEDPKMHQANNLSKQIKSLNPDDNEVAEIEFTKGKESIMMGVEMELPRGPAKDILSSEKVDQVVPFLKDAENEEACRLNMVPEVVIESFISNHKGDSPSSSKQAYDLASSDIHFVLEQVEAGVQIEGECGLGRDLRELECASTRAGSHTCTWGIRGPRHQLSGKTPRTQFKYLI